MFILTRSPTKYFKEDLVQWIMKKPLTQIKRYSINLRTLLESDKIPEETRQRLASYLLDYRTRMEIAVNDEDLDEITSISSNFLEIIKNDAEINNLIGENNE